MQLDCYEAPFVDRNKTRKYRVSPGNIPEKVDSLLQSAAAKKDGTRAEIAIVCRFTSEADDSLCFFCKPLLFC